MSTNKRLVESTTRTPPPAMKIRKRHTTMFPSLVVGMLIVTTLANWKLLELALVSSTREIMAEELSFRMPPSWRKFYNHSVVVDLQRQGQEQRQQQASVTVDNDAGKKARKTPTSIIETTNFTKYYFLHIPKAGGNSMRDALTHNRACVIDNGAQKHIRNYDNWTFENPQYRVFMSEGLGFNEAEAEEEAEEPPHHHRPSKRHNLVMFRDPQSHVLSQYFHCTESRRTQKKRPRLNVMPKRLHEWLQIWEETRQSKPLAEQKITLDAHEHWSDPRMKCYNPINFQSWITGYPQSKQELAEKFDAIGLLSEFHLSSCVFSTVVLNRVPQVCNCSTMTSTSNDDNNNNNNNTDSTRHDHGVAHHGDSFQSSDEELKLIRNLTMHDQILYDNAKEMFYAKVADLERQYRVTFCSSAPAGKQKKQGPPCPSRNKKHVYVSNKKE